MVYWITSSVFTVVQSALFRFPMAQKMLKIGNANTKRVELQAKHIKDSLHSNNTAPNHVVFKHRAKQEATN